MCSSLPSLGSLTHQSLLTSVFQSKGGKIKRVTPEPVADDGRLSAIISDGGSRGRVTLILAVVANNKKHVFLGFDYKGLT